MSKSQSETPVSPRSVTVSFVLLSFRCHHPLQSLHLCHELQTPTLPGGALSSASHIGWPCWLRPLCLTQTVNSHSVGDVCFRQFLSCSFVGIGWALRPVSRSSAASCQGHSSSIDTLHCQSVGWQAGCPAAAPPLNRPGVTAAATASCGGVFTGATPAHSQLHQLHCWLNYEKKTNKAY